MLIRLFFAAILLLAARRSCAVDFFFIPDTICGDVGDTVTISGRIGESSLMSGYTVYLGYDTTKIRLASPPQPGALIQGRSGLEFYYRDHIPIFPDRLDIGATVDPAAAWIGPGELFTVRFRLLDCAIVPINAPYFPRFVNPQGETMPWTFSPADIIVCDRMPLEPTHVTIQAAAGDSVLLRWNAVTSDILGRPIESPEYLIYGQPIQMSPPAFTLVAVTSDTFFCFAPDISGSVFFVAARTEEQGRLRR